MKGLVTINKINADGSKETLLKEGCNILTDGFGISVVNVFTSDGSENSDDLRIGYFQLGTSGYSTDPDWTDHLPSATASNFYELSGPLSSVSEYGADTTLKAVSRNIITVVNPFAEASALKYQYENQILCEFEDDAVSNILDTHINCKFTIDEKGAVGKSLKEFGLFVRNPEHHKDFDRPVLAAYKLLADPIEKTDEFSLDIEWVIDVSNEG